MLKLFMKKRTRVKNLKSELEKASTIKLDLTKYSNRSLKKTIYVEENKKSYNLKIQQQENKLNEIYQNVNEITLGNLDYLNSLSLLELKQIMSQIDNIPYGMYNDKECFKQLKFLIQVGKKIEQILISKAVEVLNEARTLHNCVTKMIIENNEYLPIELIEAMKKELKACLSNVDFKNHTDIQLDINKIIIDLEEMLTTESKEIILKLKKINLIK